MVKGLDNTVKAFFQERGLNLRSGKRIVIPNGFVAAPMEENPVANNPFVTLEEISRMRTKDVMDLCRILAEDRAYVLENFDYRSAGGVVKIGDGIPSIATFLKTEAQARGGWGIVFVEATSPRAEYAARKRGLLLDVNTFPYHRRLVQVFRDSSAYADQKIMIQLTHAGWCAQEPVTYRNVFGKGANPPKEGFIAKVLNEIENAAVLAASAGYDGVDIKLCHGYGLADWALEMVRDCKTAGQMERNLAPYLETFKSIRERAAALGYTDFAVGFRFSTVEGTPNGWGVKYDRTFNGSLVTDLEGKFNQLETDIYKSLAAIQVLAAQADYIHSSLGIPALTPTLVRGTAKNNRQSPISHLEIAQQIYQTLREADIDIPVIVSNLTTAGPVTVYTFGRNRLENNGPAFGSMGRQSIRNPLYPIQLQQGNVVIDYCSTCGGCSERLKAQTTPSGCVYDSLMKAVYSQVHLSKTG